MFKNVGEFGFSSSGVSISFILFGIDSGYSIEERIFSVGSFLNDIERLLFYFLYVESSVKKEKEDVEV